MKVTILKWHDAKLVDPEADGDYLIFPEGSGLRDCSYTAAGGWNTYIDEDGNPCRVRSDEDRERWKSYVRYWAYQPTEALNIE